MRYGSCVLFIDAVIRYVHVMATNVDRKIFLPVLSFACQNRSTDTVGIRLSRGRRNYLKVNLTFSKLLKKVDSPVRD